MFLHVVAEIEIPTLDGLPTETTPKSTPGKRKRATHEPKDPNAPRRPQTAYMIFTNEMRKTIREEHPDKSISERAKIISKLWSEIDAEKKKVSCTENLQ